VTQPAPATASRLLRRNWKGVWMCAAERRAAHFDPDGPHFSAHVIHHAVLDPRGVAAPY